MLLKSYSSRQTKLIFFFFFSFHQMTCLASHVNDFVFCNILQGSAQSGQPAAGVHRLPAGQEPAAEAHRRAAGQPGAAAEGAGERAGPEPGADAADAEEQLLPELRELS